MRVDIVVIGGGIAGASAAHELSKSASVVLVERETQFGAHATGRSAALLNETVGNRVICDLAAASRGFFSSPPPGFCDHPLVSDRGLLWVGRDGAQPAMAALAAGAPARADVLDLGRARTLVPSLSAAAMAAGALYEPAAMTIDVSSLLAGYVRGVRRTGAVVSTSWEALRLARRSGCWVVQSAGIEIEAEVVVNAAGAWGDIVAARAGVTPIGLCPLKRTAALVAAADAVAAWPMVMDVEGAWYAMPEPGGLLISPADERPSEPGEVVADEIDVAIAIERAGDALGIGIRSVRRAWAGLRTFCLDRHPTVGVDPDAPGFVWLVGQGGSGIKTAPALAELVAHVVHGGGDPPPVLSPARWR